MLTVFAVLFILLIVVAGDRLAWLGGIAIGFCWNLLLILFIAALRMTLRRS